MNQLKKHILFFDFLENHYVSKNEVSKQHLNVIKKSNFVKEDKTTVRSTHPPLETILILLKRRKWRPPLSKLLILKPLSLVLLNRTILLMNPYMLLVNCLTVLKKKLLKKLFLLKTLFLKNMILSKLRNLWLIYLVKEKKWISKPPKLKLLTLFRKCLQI